MSRIDCLYVEQEVVADDTPAVIAVMKADKARRETFALLVFRVLNENRMQRQRCSLWPRRIAEQQVGRLCVRRGARKSGSFRKGGTRKKRLCVFVSGRMLQFVHCRRKVCHLIRTLHFNGFYTSTEDLVLTMPGSSVYLRPCWRKE